MHRHVCYPAKISLLACLMGGQECGEALKFVHKQIFRFVEIFTNELVIICIHVSE